MAAEHDRAGPGSAGSHTGTRPSSQPPPLATRPSGRSVEEIGQLLGNGKVVSRQTVFRALGVLAT